MCYVPRGFTKGTGIQCRTTSRCSPRQQWRGQSCNDTAVLLALSRPLCPPTSPPSLWLKYSAKPRPHKDDTKTRVPSTLLETLLQHLHQLNLLETEVSLQQCVLQEKIGCTCIRGELCSSNEPSSVEGGGGASVPKRMRT